MAANPLIDGLPRIHPVLGDLSRFSVRQLGAILLLDTVALASRPAPAQLGEEVADVVDAGPGHRPTPTTFVSTSSSSGT